MDPASKNALRALMKSLLSEVSQDQLLRASELICRNIADSMELFGHPQTIGVYSAHGQEIQLHHLHRLLSGKRIAYPKCRDDHQLSFHYVDDPGELRIGKYGIHEPAPEMHEELTPDSLDLILCPGLAFSKDGCRLGKGGGYYDRILEHFQGIKCGITMSSQVLDHIPHEPHDSMMDYLASEAGILITRPCSG